MTCDPLELEIHLLARDAIKDMAERYPAALPTLHWCEDCDSWVEPWHEAEKHNIWRRNEFRTTIGLDVLGAP